LLLSTTRPSCTLPKELKRRDTRFDFFFFTPFPIVACSSQGGGPPPSSRSLVDGLLRTHPQITHNFGWEPLEKNHRGYGCPAFHPPGMQNTATPSSPVLYTRAKHVGTPSPNGRKLFSLISEPTFPIYHFARRTTLQGQTYPHPTWNSPKTNGVALGPARVPIRKSTKT